MKKHLPTYGRSAFALLTILALIGIAGRADALPSGAAATPTESAAPEEIVEATHAAGLRPIDDSDDAVEVGDSVNAVALAFTLIPDTDLDLLSSDTRWEMELYMMADSIVKKQNVYTGLSWIEEMDSDYMKVHLTDVSSLQLKELPCKSLRDDRLIMTIYTIAGEGDTADSTIKFYALRSDNDSVGLAPLKTAKYFRLPDPKDFYSIPKGSGITLKEALDEMPFHTVAYSVGPGSDTLTGRLTVDNYLTVEQRRRLEPYLRPELHWKWTGKDFRLEK
ncbi:MAG: DUF3256 family protein [Muribaculaceae bacterium]|nr:DUF3256 family protein [Muribaculaceae bacterium]